MRPRKQGSLELTSSALLETIICKYLSGGTWWKRHHMLQPCNRMFPWLINVFEILHIKHVQRQHHHSHLSHSGWQSWSDKWLLPVCLKLEVPPALRSYLRYSTGFWLRRETAQGEDLCAPPFMAMPSCSLNIYSEGHTMDWGAWWNTVHGLAKSQTWPSD